MPEQKQLVRSQRERVFAGVAGGLAEYLGLDATFVRLLFVLALFVTWLTALLYLAAWYLLPEAQPPTTSS